MFFLRVTRTHSGWRVCIVARQKCARQAKRFSSPKLAVPSLTRSLSSANHLHPRSRRAVSLLQIENSALRERINHLLLQPFGTNITSDGVSYLHEALHPSTFCYSSFLGSSTAYQASFRTFAAVTGHARPSIERSCFMVRGPNARCLAPQPLYLVTEHHGNGVRLCRA